MSARRLPSAGGALGDAALGGLTVGGDPQAKLAATRTSAIESSREADTGATLAAIRVLFCPNSTRGLPQFQSCATFRGGDDGLHAAVWAARHRSARRRRAGGAARFRARAAQRRLPGRGVRLRA